MVLEEESFDYPNKNKGAFEEKKGKRKETVSYSPTTCVSKNPMIPNGPI
jgi:hypothetical protein